MWADFFMEQVSDGVGRGPGHPCGTPRRPRSTEWPTRSSGPSRTFPDDEMRVCADEVDIHLNPKIGPCWIPKGMQFEVETPGKNQKRYVFGGLNPTSET